MGVVDSGTYGVLAVDGEDKAIKLFKNIIQDNRTPGTVDAAAQLIKDSFSEMVERFRSEGVHVGGEIYSEMITSN